MNNLIDIMEMSTGEIQELIDKAMDIIANPQKYSEVLYISSDITSARI